MNHLLLTACLFLAALFSRDCLNAQHTFLISRPRNESPTARRKSLSSRWCSLKTDSPFPQIKKCAARKEMGLGCSLCGIRMTIIPLPLLPSIPTWRFISVHERAAPRNQNVLGMLLSILPIWSHLILITGDFGIFPLNTELQKPKYGEDLGALLKDSQGVSKR